MPILAMTREIGSLGTYVGQAVARRLGYELVRQEIIQAAARLYPAETEALVATVEAKPPIWPANQSAARRNFAFVAAEVFNAALKDNVVIVGRWSALLLGGIAHVLRVRVCAPVELRARRLMERMALPAEEAERRIRQSDAGIRSRMRQFFDADWDDPRLYDLTLNTERASVEECAGLLIGLLTLPAWQASEASRAALWDAALTARVRAALRADPDTARLEITIRAKDGRLELAGTVEAPAAGEAAARIAALHAGVGRVDNRLTVTDPAHLRLSGQAPASAGTLRAPAHRLRLQADRL